MAWKYTGTAKASGIDRGRSSVVRQNEIVRVRQEQNKKAKAEARQTDINDSIELWNKVTNAGDLSPSDEFNSRTKSEFLAPMINQYSEIVSGMNKGSIPVDIGTQALAQLNSNINTYTTFVSLSNDVNQKYEASLDIDEGKVGAIQTNANNDIPALQLNNKFHTNPKDLTIRLDKSGSPIVENLVTGEVINMTEFNSAMQNGIDFVQTIPDNTKLMETAVTNILGDMQNKGKIEIIDKTNIRNQTTQNLYNYPAIKENMDALMPFNGLTNSYSTASASWEGMGELHEEHGSVWEGTDDQIKAFNEYMNQQALDKFIPANQRYQGEDPRVSKIVKDKPKPVTRGKGKISEAVFAKDVSPLIDAAIEMKDDIEKLEKFEELKTKVDGVDDKGWLREYKKIMIQPQFNKLQEEIKAIPGYEKADNYLSQFINQELKIGKDTIMVGDFTIIPTKRGEIGVLFLDEEGLPINKEPFAFKETQLKSMVNKFPELKRQIMSKDENII